MKDFLGEDFLLQSETAKRLFALAEKQPIIDYHCHLVPQEIYENKKFEDITEAWLAHDHYKWRFLRFCGVSEALITGDASPKEKFMAFAKHLYLAIGHPLYHWTHLELQRYFGINEVLCERTAEDIWERACRVIRETDFTPQALIARSNVRALCTTDDPASDLRYHILLRQEGKCTAKVLPTFRPDRALSIGKPDFAAYLQELAGAAGIEIASYAALVEVLAARLAFFKENGCVLSDHSLEWMDFCPYTDAQAGAAFEKRLKGGTLTKEEEHGYFTNLFLKLGRLYAQNGIAMQVHIGAQRNNNTAMFEKLGPDTGFDSIGDFAVAEGIGRYLDTLEAGGLLPKTVLYTLNPKDNYVLSTMAGNFQGDGVRGKVQFGTAWWFNDNKDGMEAQLHSIANTGALGTFVGMLTDSRSFLSYTRHEYFRRILCNYLGGLVENGEYPNDEEALASIVKGICFENANRYFGFQADC